MIKADIIAAVRNGSPELSRQDATELVNSVIGMIVESLEAGDDVLISGFGKFEVRDKRARPGRNPITGDKIEIKARKVVTFKPSAALRERMNGDQQ